MTPSPAFNGTVREGKLHVRNSPMFLQYLQQFEGQDIQVIVRKRRKDRSLEQNAWYWSCVVGIPAKHFGYTPEEMHEAFKMKFLRQERQGAPATIRSTTSLSTLEFTEYVEIIRSWLMLEYMIDVPDPDKVAI